MKVLITVPDLRLQGGVANIYRSLKWDNPSKAKYFYNTTLKNSIKPWFIPIMVFRFIKGIRKVDLVHLNPSLDAKAVIRDGLLILLAKLFNKKVIVFFHGWEDDFEQKIVNNAFYKQLFRGVFNKVDAYCLLGYQFENKLIRIGISLKHVFHLPTVADDKYLNSSTSYKPLFTKNKISLLFISRFVPLKGMDIVLNTFMHLQANPGDFQFELIMAGDGPQLDNCKEFVSRNNLQQVTFTGYIDGPKKHECLQKADIFFFPSYNEGLPCVIMEAMLYGLPVVSRPVGGIPDWIKQNENGWLSESTDPVIFSKGIMSLVSQPELLKIISENNHKIAKANFTPSAFIQQLDLIYTKILYGSRKS